MGNKSASTLCGALDQRQYFCSNLRKQLCHRLPGSAACPSSGNVQKAEVSRLHWIRMYLGISFSFWTNLATTKSIYTYIYVYIYIYDAPLPPHSPSTRSFIFCWGISESNTRVECKDGRIWHEALKRLHQLLGNEATACV